METKLTDQKAWWQATTIYQIYPRSYKDSNGDGIGDLTGIISKLDYIKDAGFETIWLSPFFASPQADFGYDISDYLAIAPEYGDMAKAEELIAEIHARNMYVVFDMVLNHTSDQHPWFRESASGRDNAKSDWYIWRQSRGKGAPNNWQAKTGGSGWHFVPARDQWYFASFLPFQPDLNYRNPAVKETMFDIVHFWLDKGVDGYRLDIFNVIYKDQAFRNNPRSLNPLPSEEKDVFGFYKPTRTMNLPEAMDFAKELRAVADEFTDPPRLLLGEVFGRHPTIKRFLGERQEGLNLIFLFDLLYFQFSARFFRDKLREYEREYAPPLAPTYVFSNHDKRRSIGRVDADLGKAKLLALFQFTARGVAITYQGEEIGMTDTPLSKKTALDPVSHHHNWLPQFVRDRMSQLVNRDECRTPMQWDGSDNSGFCEKDVIPWLPVNDNYRAINVAAQAKDTDSLLQTYRQLLALRTQSPALKWGGLQLDHDTPNDVLGYRRIEEGQTLQVYINFGDDRHSISTDAAKILFSTHSQNVMDAGKLQLQSISGVILSY